MKLLPKPKPFAGTEWEANAACAGMDQDIFYIGRGGSSMMARLVCSYCPVQRECLEYALHFQEQYGIWGGTSERERRMIRRERRLGRLAS